VAKLVAIDNTIHKSLAVDLAKAELSGAELNLIPVVVAEFVNLAVQYPIVITKNGDTGEFVCVAMLGFEAHENLFWQNGQWQGLYVPLQIQRQPFFISDPTGDSSDLNKDYVVCFDVESPMIVENNSNAEVNGEKLFGEDGQDSEFFKQAKNILAHLLQGEIDNKAFISSLITMDLIQPLSLEITFINEQSTRLNGLYTIDKNKLASLANDRIIELHQLGLLQPIYTMVASLGQIYALIERKNDRIR
jgi:hypothetical protein